MSFKHHWALESNKEVLEEKKRKKKKKAKRKPTSGRYGWGGYAGYGFVGMNHGVGDVSGGDGGGGE